jgi:beta-galactosidase
VQPVRRVLFDAHSLIIDGRREFIRSGAFHYYRLPAPNLWKERLLKIKRAGYNAVDLYFSWGYHTEAPGQYDFTGVRDVDYLLALTEDIGLYVIARPGPYINSELDGGGLPAWLLAMRDIPLRCRDVDNNHVDSPRYLAYVSEWYDQIVPRIARHPNVILFQIENEYATNDLTPSYMRALYDAARRLGVTCPIIHNDPFRAGAWADLVDIYGVDDYAIIRFDKDWRGNASLFAALDSLSEVKKDYAPTRPLAIVELQGGWFSGWTGIPYEEMRAKLGRESLTIATWTAIANGITIYSHYMFVGGTNWNYIGAPAVQTSYDFSAPVTEWGGTSERYHAAKAIATLVGTFSDLFAQSDPMDDVWCSDPSLLYRVRGYGEARLVFLRNLGSVPRAVTLRYGPHDVGDVLVKASDMRCLIMNLPFVDAHVFSSCDIFTALHRENQHLLVFSGPGTVRYHLPAPCRILKDEVGTQVDGTTVTITYDGIGWKDHCFSSGGHRYRSLFLPSSDEAYRVEDYVVLGPSYVGEYRHKGGVVDLPRDEMRMQSDAPKDRYIRVYSVGHLNRAEIDDEMVHASYDGIAGYLRLELPCPPKVTLPRFTSWRIHSASPEVSPTYDDSDWRAVAAHEALDMDSLGISKGIAWYRGHYTGRMSSLRLAIRHHAAIYVNGRFVQSLDAYHAESGDDDHEPEYEDPVTVDLPMDIQTDGDNTLAIAVESLGHNKGFFGNERWPRGILSVEADRAIAWRIRAGVWGEAEGVAQPHYDDQAWATAPNLAAMPDSDMVWTRARLSLNLPGNAWVPIGLYLEGVADKVHVYVNGVLTARDWRVCPQRLFYLPEGILNHHGENVITLLLWRRGQQAQAGQVELRPYRVESSHFVNVL